MIDQQNSTAKDFLSQYAKVLNKEGVIWRNEDEEK